MRRLLPALLFVGLLAPLPAFAGVKVQNAHAFETAEGMKNGAVFLEIENDAGADRLISATTPASARTEIHTMRHENGVMKMRRIDGIDIGKDAKAALSPSGDHLMLMDLDAPLQAGKTYPLDLEFEKAGKVAAEFTVRSRKPDAHQSHGAHADPHSGHK
jgi:periplasmic copper chaperone A